MKERKQKLILEQTDRKLQPFRPLVNIQMPTEGWINTIRVALNMQLRQLGKRMSISAQGVKGLEISEKNGTITLQSLKEVAMALNMKLVYGFVPAEGSLDEMVTKKARETAWQIISRTSHTMKLEDQENSKERLARALDEKTTELRTEMPKYLWE